MHGDWKEYAFDGTFHDLEPVAGAVPSYLELVLQGPEYWPDAGRIVIYLWLLVFEDEARAWSCYENYTVWSWVNTSAMQPLPFLMSGMLLNFTCVDPEYPDYDAIFQTGRGFCYVQCQMHGIDIGLGHATLFPTLAFLATEAAYLQHLKLLSA